VVPSGGSITTSGTGIVSANVIAGTPQALVNTLMAVAPTGSIAWQIGGGSMSQVSMGSVSIPTVLAGNSQSIDVPLAGFSSIPRVWVSLSAGSGAANFNQCTAYAQEVIAAGFIFTVHNFGGSNADGLGGQWLAIV
jgi:hypothetical protein